MMRRKIVIIQKSHKYHVSASKTKNYEKKICIRARAPYQPATWFLAVFGFAFFVLGFRSSAFRFRFWAFGFPFFTFHPFSLFCFSAVGFQLSAGAMLFFHFLFFLFFHAVLAFGFSFFCFSPLFCLSAVGFRRVRCQLFCFCLF